MTATQRQMIRGVFNTQRYVIDYSLPAMETLDKLPDRFPAEVIDNKLYVSPVPGSCHADICDRIGFELKTYLGAHDLGEIWCSGLAVHLEPGKTLVGPDIVFISKGQAHIKQPRGLFGVPDLLIEILSNNRRYDLIIKKKLYERTGVKELWYVDPLTKDAQGYLLENGKYSRPLSTNSEVNIRIFNKTIRF